MTSSHEDPDISDAWDEFGYAGPLVFWVLCEIYGREFNRLNGNGELTLSWKYFQNKTRTKRKCFQNILDFYQKRNRILSKPTDEFLTITIPKFLDLSSNWTKRTKTQGIELPTEAPTEAPTAKEEEVRSKKKKENKNKESISHSETKIFLSFYKEKFTECFGTEPQIEWGKDGSITNKLLKTIPIDELKSLLEAFFASEDKFIQGSGYTIGVFKTQINKLKIGTPGHHSGLQEWANEIMEEEHGRER